MRTQMLRAGVLAVLTSFGGCGTDYGPEYDFRWEGVRIDIVGVGTQPEQTCAGTFEYLDQFAEATAREFGVEEHLGVYRWYSAEMFNETMPCPEQAVGCAGGNGAFTRMMPHEHEVVHLANNVVVACPSVIAEGLAEFYSPTSSTPVGGQIGALIQKSEHGVIALDDYPLAGAFVAFLVETYGLESVLQICEESGPYPSPSMFSDAVSRVLGVEFQDMVSEYEGFGCTYSQYRSKHFECDADADADIVVGQNAAEMSFDLDCQSVTTVGPRKGQIWTMGQMEVLADGIYLAEVVVTGEAAGVRVELTGCGSCSDSPLTHMLVGSDLIDPVQLRAGRYSVRAVGPIDFTGSIVLRIAP